MLGLALEALRLSDQIRGELWPGFDLRRIPLAIYVPGGEALLVNHPKPPNGFTLVSNPAEWGATFHRGHASGVFDAATATEINGIMTALVPFPSTPAEAMRESLIGIIFHEAFHVFQEGMTFPQYNSLVFSSYPLTDARNNTLARFEGELLRQAVAASSDRECLEATRRFLAVRSERQRSGDEEQARYEDCVEQHEGLAHYIELKALLLAGKSPLAKGVGPLGGDPTFFGYARVHELLEQELRCLAEENFHGQNAARLRFYFTGMAQCLLLDRLQPAWKQGFIPTFPGLADRLAGLAIPEKTRMEELARLVAAEQQNLLERVKGERNFSQLLLEEEAAAAELQRDQQRHLQEVLAAPGFSIIIPTAGFSMGSMHFDPMNIESVGAHVRIHRRMFKCSFPAEHILLVFERPVVEDRQARRFITIIPEAAITADGKKWRIADIIDLQVARELTISGERLSIKGRAARLHREGNNLTLQFSADPALNLLPACQ